MSTPVYQLLFFSGIVLSGTVESVVLPAGYRCRIDAISVVNDTAPGSFSVSFISGITGARFLELFNLTSPISYLTQPRIVMSDGDTIGIAAISSDAEVYMSGIALKLP